MSWKIKFTIFLWKENNFLCMSVLNMNPLMIIQIPLIFLGICKEYGSLSHREILIQSSGYLRSVRWLIAYPVDWSKMCFSSMGLSIVKRSMNCEWYGILKIYENSKVKLISKFQKYFKIKYTKPKGRDLSPKHLPRFIIKFES